MEKQCPNNFLILKYYVFFSLMKSKNETQSVLIEFKWVFLGIT